MDILNEILKRRIPQIFGSYIIAGSSLVLFIDWLVTRYQLPEYYVTLALFGIISIIPSVFILAYFHGAPGKDQWTKVEKIGVPINLLFIVTIFFVGHFTNIFSEGSKKSLNNFYNKDTSSNESSLDYFLEVIEINDSYAIAKIIGSETPIYKVRIGDLIKMRSN